MKLKLLHTTTISTNIATTTTTTSTISNTTNTSAFVTIIDRTTN